MALRIKRNCHGMQAQAAQELWDVVQRLLPSPQ